jgi:hypothetical protein
MTKIHWRICACCGLPKALEEFRSTPNCKKCQTRTNEKNRTKTTPRRATPNSEFTDDVTEGVGDS